MTRLIPELWLPPAAGIKRVICHWTAGAYVPSAVDLEHYHLLIQGSGAPVRGDHSILANVHTNDADGYAAHTHGLNTGSVGISVCAMFNARQSPLEFGRYPVTGEQWNDLIIACADLCRAYHIAPSEQTLLMHCECEQFLGVEQRGKWDISRLPFPLKGGYRTPGEELRGRVKQLLAG